MFHLFIFSILMACGPLLAFSSVNESTVVTELSSAPFSFPGSVNLPERGAYEIWYFIQRNSSEDIIYADLEVDGERVEGSLKPFDSAFENINGHFFYIYSNGRSDLSLVIREGNCNRVDGYILKATKL